MGSLSRPPSPSAPGERQEGGGPFGQSDGGFLHQQARRDHESFPLLGGLQAPLLVSSVGHFPHRLLPAGAGQHHSRSPVKTIAEALHSGSACQGVIRRVEVESTGVQTDLQVDGSPSRRSVCISEQSSTVSVLLKRGRPGGHRRRRSVAGLGRTGRVRIPAHRPYPQSTLQDRSDEQLSDPSGGPLVASTSLVCSAARAVGRDASPPPKGSRSPGGSSPQIPCSAANSPVPPIDCLDTLQQSFQAAGLSRGAAALASKARRPSTRYTYNSRLVRFRSWCRDRQISPFSAPVDQVAEFLLSLFNDGLQANTIQGYRTAIAAIHRGFADGSCVSTNSSLASMIKGAFHERPPVKSLQPEWDLPLVLRFISRDLSNMPKLSLIDLSRRTAFLMAVASGRRCSELHALSRSSKHLSFRRSYVCMLPRAGFLSKNQSLSFTPTPIKLPDLRVATGCPDDAPWCPVRSLKFYLARTRSLGQGSDHVFISSRPPFGPASRSTISRWVKSVILDAYRHNGLHSPSFRSHSTRAVSTSWALYSGVALVDIVASAGWRGDTTFQRVYMRDVLVDGGSACATGVAALSASKTTC